MVTATGVPEEDDWYDIGMKNKNVVINMESDGEASWVSSRGELWPNQNLYKSVDWITRNVPADEVTDIDWIIELFNNTKKDDENPDPDIKSWV